MAVKVYIASCYTNGWMPENVNRQIRAQHILMDYGFSPYAPLLNHFSEIFKQRTPREWLELDLVWLSFCDILIRIHTSINGKEIPSPGADEEVLTAKKLGIKVVEVNSLEELKEWCKNYKKE